MVVGKKAAARKLVRTEQQARALQMRRDGQTLRDIGEALGVSYETVRRWINAALKEMSEEIQKNADAVRALEAHRLQKGLERTMHEIETAEKYPHRAIENLVKLSESYRKLYGLDAPQRLDVTAELSTEEIRARISAVLGLSRD